MTDDVIAPGTAPRRLKMAAAMIVSSDGKWLANSLPALRPHVDHVVIIEGCDERWVRMGNAHPDGASLDNTTEVIRAEMAITRPGLAPITYVEPKVYPHRNAQRDAYLDILREKGFDICFVVDCDEFYFPESFARVRAAFEADPDMDCAGWPFWNFYTFTRRTEETPEMERCFRIRDGYHYQNRESGQAVRDSNNVAIWTRRKRLEGIVCYHYNYVASGRDLLHKLRFYYERDGGAPEGGAINLSLVGDNTLNSITKNPFGGVYVPLKAQPPVARDLIYSGIANETALHSLLDERGTWWPISSGGLDDPAAVTVSRPLFDSVHILKLDFMRDIAPESLSEEVLSSTARLDALRLDETGRKQVAVEVPGRTDGMTTDMGTE